MRFIVHASIWDMLALIGIGCFMVVYLVVWAAAAWKERRKARK